MTKLVMVLLFFSGTSLAHGRIFRLSKETIPVHYSITIRPEFDNEIFYGEVLIYVKTTNNLPDITLHSSKLNITETYINQKKAQSTAEPDDKLMIHYEDEIIQPGENTVFIRYSGMLAENAYGFIKAPYEYNENRGYIFVTDLEPMNARSVFPCFDEPSFKAKYNLRLISPNETYKAISNMPEIKSFKTSAGVVYDFATSVLMSTYLISFAFTDYPYYEGILEDHGRNLPIRIYTFNATKNNNDFAIECTKKAIQFYSDYTNITYPLPKLDMIEYNRLETAATENWGLITFREGLLTPCLEIFTESQISLVIFHELSHFWFGNLVTNDWWNDLWLQEGLATYMSYKLSSIHENVTQVKEMMNFQFGEHFEIEIYNETSPVVSQTSRQSNISDKFNSLVYEKGAGVLLMLEDTIGEDKFRLVIQTYLKRHAFGTATTNDFISVVEEVVPDLRSRPFFESFLYQNKFPIVSLNRTADGTYVLSQEACAIAAKDKPLGQKWTIPVSYITDKSSVPRHVWFDRDMDRLEIDEKDAKWIILNPEGKGMYKTAPSTEVWKEITQVFGQLDQQEAAATLISDAYYLFRFNMLDCEVLIDLMKSIEKPSRGKWTMIFPFYDYLTDSLICSGHVQESELFWKFIRKRFVDSGYLRTPKLKTTCDHVIILPELDELPNIKQCAKWIGTHLNDFSNVNVISQ